MIPSLYWMAAQKQDETIIGTHFPARIYPARARY